MNVGGIEDRYAGIADILVENLDRAVEEIDDEFEDNEPISRADIRDRRRRVLEPIISRHKQNVIAEIEIIFGQIPNPSRADVEEKIRVIREYKRQFIPLRENITRACNLALQALRARQPEQAEEVEENEEEEEAQVEDIDNENDEELEEPQDRSPPAA